MPERWAKVKHWRQRAQEIRKAAAAIPVPSSEDHLLGIAHNYERMAADLETLLKEMGVEEPGPPK